MAGALPFGEEDGEGLSGSGRGEEGGGGEEEGKMIDPTDPFAQDVLPFSKKKDREQKERFRRKREFLAKHYEYAVPHLNKFLKALDSKRAEIDAKKREQEAAEAAARERERRMESEMDDEMLARAMGRIGRATGTTRLAMAPEVKLRIEEQEKQTEERKAHRALLEKLGKERELTFGDRDLVEFEEMKRRQMARRAEERELLKAAQLAAELAAKSKASEKKEEVAQSMLDMPWLPPNPAMARLKRQSMLHEHGGVRFCLIGERAKLRGVGKGVSLYFDFLIYALIALALMTITTLPVIVFAGLGKRIHPTRMDALGVAATSLANIGEQDLLVREELSVTETIEIDSFGNQSVTPPFCRKGTGADEFWGPYDVPLGALKLGIVPTTLIVGLLDGIAGLLFVIFFYERFYASVHEAEGNRTVDSMMHTGKYAVFVRGLPSDATMEEVREHFSSLYDPTGPDWTHWFFHPTPRPELSIDPFRDADFKDPLKLRQEQKAAALKAKRIESKKRMAAKRNTSSGSGGRQRSGGADGEGDAGAGALFPFPGSRSRSPSPLRNPTDSGGAAAPPPMKTASSTGDQEDGKAGGDDLLAEVVDLSDEEEELMAAEQKKTEKKAKKLKKKMAKKKVFRIGRGLVAADEAMDVILRARGGLNPCVPVISTTHNGNRSFAGSWAADVVLVRNQEVLLDHEARLLQIRSSLKRARDLVDKYSPTSPWRNTFEHGKAQEELRQLLLEYATLREEAPDKANATGKVHGAFVTFQMEESRQRALEDYRVFRYCCCLLPCQPRSLTFSRIKAQQNVDKDGEHSQTTSRVHSWPLVVEPADDPSFLNFRNLHLPSWQIVLRMAVSLVVVVGLVTCSIASSFASDNAIKSFSPTPASLLLCEQVLPFTSMWSVRPWLAPDATTKLGDVNISWVPEDDSTLCFGDSSGKMFIQMTSTDTSLSSVMEAAGRNSSEYGVSVNRERIAYPDGCIGACVSRVKDAVLVDGGRVDSSYSKQQCPLLVPPWVTVPSTATWPDKYGADLLVACHCLLALGDAIQQLGPSVGPATLGTGSAGDVCGATVERAATGSSLIAISAFIVAGINIGLVYLIRFLGTFIRLHSTKETKSFVTSKMMLSQVFNTVGSVVLSSTGVLDYFTGTQSWDGSTVLSFDEKWHSRVASVILLISLFSCIIPSLLILIEHYVVAPIQRRWALASVTSQRELEKWYEPPEFPMEERFVLQLTFLFSVMVFSAGFPILFLLGLMGFAVSYWLDRWLVIRLVRQTDSSNIRISKSVLLFLPALIILKFAVSFWTLSDARLLYSPVIVGRTQPECWTFDLLSKDLQDASSPLTRLRRLGALLPLIFAGLSLLYILQRRGRVHLPCIRAPGKHKSTLWPETHIDYEKRSDEDLNPPYSEHYSRIINIPNPRLTGTERREGWRLVRASHDPPGLRRRVKLHRQTDTFGGVVRRVNEPMLTWEVFAERGEWSYDIVLHEDHHVAGRALKKATKRAEKERKKTAKVEVHAEYFSSKTLTPMKSKSKSKGNLLRKQTAEKLKVGDRTGNLHGTASSAAMPGSTAGKASFYLPTNEATAPKLDADDTPFEDPEVKAKRVAAMRGGAQSDPLAGVSDALSRIEPEQGAGGIRPPPLVSTKTGAASSLPPPPLISTKTSSSSAAVTPHAPIHEDGGELKVDDDEGDGDGGAV